MSRRISTLDMTVQEQEHVRNTLHWLHTKFGKWEHVAKMLKFEDTTIVKCANGGRTIMASMAFRVARVVNVSVDELLTGRFPARGCPRCGYDSRASPEGKSR